MNARNYLAALLVANAFSIAWAAPPAPKPPSTVGDLAKRNSRVARGPFARFALPGAHDAGMFDMRVVREILANRLLATALGAAIGMASAIFGPRAIANLAMTQKDNVRTMLDIGTRYFDFRPGWLHPHILAFNRMELYHQHGAIPGYSYVAFLVDVLKWLAANPSEIVVVGANTQGFAVDVMKPTAEAVDQALSTGGRALVPLRMYFKDALVKVEVALCTGKKLFDKRQAIKDREDKRNMQKALRRR